MDNAEAPLPPSRAYEEAINSPVYRLSELMFGSLLAAYVLGFISFSFSPSLPLLNNVPYLFISLTYAYVTAGFYLSYHAGILTMPTMPLERLRHDFALALATAVAFGYSMRYPKVFPTLLGLTILGSIYRQHHEYKLLANQLFDLYGRPPAAKLSRAQSATMDPQKNFKHKLADQLRKHTELRPWNTTGWTLVLWTVVPMIASNIIWFVPSLQGSLETTILSTETLVIFMLVLYHVLNVLKQRAAFLYDRNQPKIRMDDQYERLIDYLSKATNS